VEEIKKYCTLQWKIYSSTEHCNGRYTAVLNTAMEDIKQYLTLQWKMYSSTEHCSGRYKAVLNTATEDIYSNIDQIGIKI
jgi:uncharacterized protein YjaG (DUF416 family)